MSIEDLQNKELESLNEEELFDLESLITEGANAKVPVKISYGDKSFGATLRPLTNVEWNNATRKSMKNVNTTSELELLKVGLTSKDDKPIPVDILVQLPTGVITELAKKLADISGVKLDKKENIELAKTLMGF